MMEKIFSTKKKNSSRAVSRCSSFKSINVISDSDGDEQEVDHVNHDRRKDGDVSESERELSYDEKKADQQDAVMGSAMPNSSSLDSPKYIGSSESFASQTPIADKFSATLNKSPFFDPEDLIKAELERSLEVAHQLRISHNTIQRKKLDSESPQERFMSENTLTEKEEQKEGTVAEDKRGREVSKKRKRLAIMILSTLFVISLAFNIYSGA